LLENVRTLQDLNEVIADVPDLYKRWMDAAIPRSEFKDEKSWIDAIKSKILGSRLIKSTVQARQPDR
jgi:hypothetical protein